MLDAKTGISHGVDSYAVAVEAATAARGDDERKILLAYILSSVKYDQSQVLNGVKSVLGSDAKIVGASTAGEITEIGPAHTESVAVMILYSEDIRVYTADALNGDGGAHAAGATMASILKAEAGSDEIKLVMMFPDVLTGNGADTVRGVQEIMGKNFPIVGGAPGDDFRFEKTYQYHNGKVMSGAVVGVAFCGDISFGIGVRHGWIPVGPPMKVTKADGAVIHEIENKPAIEIYTDYFGEEVGEELKTETLAKTAVTYPLGMRADQSEELLIRDPLTVDEHGSITCAAEIPEGSEVRLMLGSKEEAINHAALAAAHAKSDLDGKDPAAIIIFNCIARSKLFADRSGEEIDVIQEQLGEKTPLIGFYTYGEQAPLNGEVRNLEKCNSAFHNETIVIVALM